MPSGFTTQLFPRYHGILGLAALVGCLAISGQQALASTPAEQVFCTQAPRSQWVGEARIREIFGTQDYVTIAFKESKTHCYEFYAIRKDGDVIEAYYHPVSAALLKYSRMSPHGGTIGFTRSLKPQPRASGLAIRADAVRQ